MTFKIERINGATIINLYGWRIRKSDGSTLQPFTTKREAEKLIEFFTEVPNEN